MRSTLELRDRSLVDVLDLAVRFMATHWKKYVPLFALVVLPWFLITWAIGEFYDWGFAWLVAIFAGLFVQAPFSLLASRLVFEESVPLGQVMKDAMVALPKLLFVRIAQVAIIAMGFMMVVVGGLWAGSAFFFVTEAALLERAGVSASMSRANRLVKGSTGESLIAVVLLLVLEVAFVFMGEYAGRSVMEDFLQVNAPPSFLDVGGSALAFAGFWLFVPYRATARFLAYINLRTRAEGWDVQTSFFALAARAKGDEETAAVSTRGGKAAA